MQFVYWTMVSTNTLALVSTAGIYRSAARSRSHRQAQAVIPDQRGEQSHEVRDRTAKGPHGQLGDARRHRALAQ